MTSSTAFDHELFTVDQEYRLQMNPSFETQRGVLRETNVDRAGEQIALADGGE